MTQEFGVIIHGGVGSLADQNKYPRYILPMQTALDAAWSSLKAGLPPERAAVNAIRVLEACELFDAGYGSFPNTEGEVYLDVGLMRGNGDFIALMNLSHVFHPSEVAFDLLIKDNALQKVWTDADRARLARSEAELKKRYGWVATHAELTAPLAIELNKAASKIVNFKGGGTVGCVIRDGDGKIVALTSTGGTPNKVPGRIGDSPIVGAGVYANDSFGGLSATGHGESIMGSLLSGHILHRMRESVMRDELSFSKNKGLLGEIVQEELKNMERDFPDAKAGIIVMPKRGTPIGIHNSRMMPVAWRCGNESGITSEGCEV
jgi:beta-aspartyl-peptidase (threonine type)